MFKGKQEVRGDQGGELAQRRRRTGFSELPGSGWGMGTHVLPSRLVLPSQCSTPMPGTMKLTRTRDQAPDLAQVSEREGSIPKASPATLVPGSAFALALRPLPCHVWAGWASLGARCLLHREAIYEPWVFCLFT